MIIRFETAQVRLVLKIFLADLDACNLQLPDWKSSTCSLGKKRLNKSKRFQGFQTHVSPQPLIVKCSCIVDDVFAGLLLLWGSFAVALVVRCSAFSFAAIAPNPRHFLRHSRTTPTPPSLFNSLLFYFPHLSSLSLSNNKRLSSFSPSSASDLCSSLLSFLFGRHSFSQAWVSFRHGQPCCDDDCVVSLISSLLICFYMHFHTFLYIFVSFYLYVFKRPLLSASAGVRMLPWWCLFNFLICLRF